MGSFAIRLFSLTATLLLTNVHAAADSRCYLRDGTWDDQSQPCNPDADVSHCCQYASHVYLSNHLCFDISHNHVIEGTQTLGRDAYFDSSVDVTEILNLLGACTDPTWSDTACAQYCQNIHDNGWGDLRQCDGSNDQWVCGQNVSDCSDSFSIPYGYISDLRLSKLPPILDLPAVYTEGSATRTTTTTVTVTATGLESTASSNLPSCASSNSSEKTRLGLGLGLGLGLTLATVLIGSLFLLRRAQRKIKQLESQRAYQSCKQDMHNGLGYGNARHEPHVGAEEADGGQIHEISGTH